MTFRVEVRGMREVLDALDRMDPKSAKSKVQKALTDANKKVLAPKVKAATPWRRMKAAVTVRVAKRGKPGSIVLYNSKKAWFRHFLIGGTRTHEVKPKRAAVMAWQSPTGRGFSRGHTVRGLRANPVISRVADQHGDEALDHVERFLVRDFGLD